MQVLKAELHKLFIKRYFLAAVAVLLVVESLTIFWNIKKAIVLDEVSLQIYKTYINRYSGEITDENKTAIDKLIDENNDIFSRIEKLNEDYANENIATEEYNRQISELSSFLDASDGFNAFERDYYTALSRNTPLVDTTAWNCLFSEESIDIFLVMILILFVIELVIYDEETGINVLKFSTKNGKKDIYLKQLFIVITTSFLLSITVSATRFLTAKFTYGLDCYDAPIRCFDAFIFNSTEAGVFKIFVAVSVIKAIGGVMLCITALAVGCLTRTSLYTAFGTVCAVYLPGYIFSESELKYFVPLPSSLLMAEGYFKPEITGKTIASGENFLYIFDSEIYIKFGIFVLIILFVFTGLTVFSYTKSVRRKSP